MEKYKSKFEVLNKKDLQEANDIKSKLKKVQDDLRTAGDKASRKNNNEEARAFSDAIKDIVDILKEIK